MTSVSAFGIGVHPFGPDAEREVVHRVFHEVLGHRRRRCDGREHNRNEQNHKESAHGEALLTNRTGTIIPACERDANCLPAVG